MLSPEAPDITAEGTARARRLPTRRLGWAIFLWGTGVWPFYIITAGLPLLGLHTLLSIAAVVAYVLAGGRMILGVRGWGPVQGWIVGASALGVLAISLEWETGAPVWLALSLIWPLASLLVRIELSGDSLLEPVAEDNVRTAYLLNFGLATWFAIWTFMFLRWTLIFPTPEEVMAGGRDGTTGVILMFFGWVAPIPVVLGTVYLSWTSGTAHRSLRLMAISGALIYLSLGAGSIAYVSTTAWLTLRRLSHRQGEVGGSTPA